MKRHAALAPLSREHHHSLILAQLLKKDAPIYKGLPQKPEDKVVYALHTFKASIEPHFKKEEIIFEKIKDCNATIQTLVEEIITEHRELSVGFQQLAESVNIVEALDKLGRALENHIRKEERILFPLIQQNCPEEILKKL